MARLLWSKRLEPAVGMRWRSRRSFASIFEPSRRACSSRPARSSGCRLLRAGHRGRRRAGPRGRPPRGPPPRSEPPGPSRPRRPRGQPRCARPGRSRLPGAQRTSVTRGIERSSRRGRAHARRFRRRGPSLVGIGGRTRRPGDRHGTGFPTPLPPPGSPIVPGGRVMPVTRRLATPRLWAGARDSPRMKLGSGSTSVGRGAPLGGASRGFESHLPDHLTAPAVLTAPASRSSGPRSHYARQDHLLPHRVVAAQEGGRRDPPRGGAPRQRQEGGEARPQGRAWDRTRRWSPPARPAT